MQQQRRYYGKKWKKGGFSHLFSLDLIRDTSACLATTKQVCFDIHSKNSIGI
jgi:hypothetical protein